ncbi:MAG: NAD-glutamate dehydrogenase [Planctomycetes bacterium]|nr:NAD-glutamate dehydrogenase [Planctomycetota bacterium]
MVGHSKPLASLREWCNLSHCVSAEVSGMQKKAASRTAKGENLDRLLEEVVDHLRSKLPRETTPAAERFLRQFYANVSPKDLESWSREQLYGRPWPSSSSPPGAPRTPVLRVYNPTVATQAWQCPHTGHRDHQR